MIFKKLKLPLLLIILNFLLPTNLQAAGIADFSPVAHWTCDETSGTRLDSTTNNNDLTDNNTVGSAAGLLSNACDFESTSNEYLSITDAAQANLDLSANYTMSAWVNFESLPSSNAYTIISKMAGASANRSYYFGYDNNWHNGPTRWVAFSRQNSTLGTSGYYSVTPSTATWYHVAVTHDASAASGNGENIIYINGSAVATTHSEQDGGGIANTAEPVRIGADDDGGVGRYFDGLIDEISIFPSELTSGDITTLYNSGTPLDYEGSGEPPATTSTSTVSFDDSNMLFMLGFITFLLVLMVLGLFFSTVRKK